MEQFWTGDGTPKSGTKNVFLYNSHAAFRSIFLSPDLALYLAFYPFIPYLYSLYSLSISS